MMFATANQPGANTAWHMARPRRASSVSAPPAPLPRDHDPATQLAMVTLNRAIADLPNAQRAVLIEIQFRGRTVDGAAVALGIPTETVKSRLTYALRALRRALDQRRRP